MLNKIGRRESKRPRIAALEPHFSDVSGEVRGTEDVNGEGDFQQLGPAAERMSSPIPPRNPRDTHDTRDTLEDQLQQVRAQVDKLADQKFKLEVILITPIEKIRAIWVVKFQISFKHFCVHCIS
jgi:hypothetical protein